MSADGASYDAVFVCQDGVRLAPARVRCYRFAEMLATLGLKTRVLSFVGDLGVPDLGGGPVNYLGDHQKLALNAKAMETLLGYPDAVLITQKIGYHFPAVLGAAATNGNPIILDYDDFDFACESWPQLGKHLPHFRPEAAFRAVAGAAAGITVASHRLREIVGQMGFASTVIPTGPDLSRFVPGVPGQARAAGRRVRFWWGGEIWSKEIAQNLMLTFDCLARVPEALRDRIEIVLCGFGYYYESFCALVRERYEGHLALDLQGAIPPDDMPAFIDGIDVGLMPLNGDAVFDQCKSPTKMFEVMAMAKPVVADRCGEPAIVIADGIDGMLAQSVEEWTAKLAVLVESPRMREAMGRAARRKIERHYAVQTVVPRLAGLIEQVRRRPMPAATAAAAAERVLVPAY